MVSGHVPSKKAMNLFWCGGKGQLYPFIRHTIHYKKFRVPERIAQQIIFPCWARKSSTQKQGWHFAFCYQAKRDLPGARKINIAVFIHHLQLPKYIWLNCSLQGRDSVENANQGGAIHGPTTASANVLPNWYLKDGLGIDKNKGILLQGICFYNSVGLPAGFLVSVWKNTWTRA